ALATPPRSPPIRCALPAVSPDGLADPDSADDHQHRFGPNPPYGRDANPDPEHGQKDWAQRPARFAPDGPDTLVRLPAPRHRAPKVPRWARAACSDPRCRFAYWQWDAQEERGPARYCAGRAKR